MAIGHWLLDRIWPTLEGGELQPPATQALFTTASAQQVPALIHARLVDEMAAESDRRRAVEAKLVAAGTVAPISVTVLAAVVTFATSGRTAQYTHSSVVAIAFAGLYASLQFLRATVAAVQGLRRRSYAAPRITDILNDATGSEDGYLTARCLDLAARIEQHREVTNGRVSDLALAHDAILNAIVGLVAAVAFLLIVTLFGIA